MIEGNNIVGVVLAGGKSTRMGGGDKALLNLNGKTIINTVARRLSAQVHTIAINTNSSATEFHALGVDVFSDTLDGYQGPLAGVLASMLWAKKNHRTATHLVTVAGDTPFFPLDLVPILSRGAPSSDTIVIAQSQGNNHAVFALWPLNLCDNLQEWLRNTDTLKVMAWVKMHPHHFIEFPLENGLDPFFNINTPDDLKMAERFMENAGA